MARKVTKSGMKRKLDKLCSEIVRSRGFCARCRKDDYEKLQTAHIFSRTYNAVRYDIDCNLLCLCASCHWYFHKNPIIFGEWVRDHLGETRYALLKSRANSIKKWTVEEMQELYETLRRA